MLQTGQLKLRGEFVVTYVAGMTGNEVRTFRCGTTIGRALEAFGAPDEGNFRAFVGGDFVSDRDGWRNITPGPGDIVAIRHVPQWDLIYYAIIILAVVASVVSLVLSLTAKQPERDSQSRFDSPTLRGARNRVAPHEPIPRVYGKMRFHPPLGAYTYTEVTGGDHYLRCLFVAGYGPLAIDVADMRIGETPLLDFEDVEVEVRPGELTDPEITLYPAQVTQDEANATIYNPGMSTEDLVLGEAPGAVGWVTRTSDENTDEIGLEIFFPAGLGYVSAKGKNRTHPLEFVIEYRPVGAGPWFPVPLSVMRLSSPLRKGTVEHALTDGHFSIEQIRFGSFVTGINFSVFPRGQYEVRVKNVFNRGITEGRTDSVVGECRLTVVKSFRNEAPWTRPGIALIALRIKATDQLQGTIDDFSIIARSKLPTWNGSVWTAPVETRNAAWIYADILRGSANPDPIADELIDAARLADWAAAIEAHTVPDELGNPQLNPMYFDGIFDFRTTVYRTLSDVAAAARATPHMRDGLFSVIFDYDKSAEPPVQMITPKNIVRGSFIGRKVFIEEAEGYRIGFKNAAKDYGDDEVLVFSPGFDASTARIYEKIEWLGITDQDRVIDETRYLIASRRHRPEVFRFEMDIENIVFERGDLVLFAHDVPLLGLAYGAITDVAFTGGGDVESITLDEECTFVFGTSYGVRIRRHQSTFDVIDSVAVVNPSVGDDVTTKVLTFVTPLDSADAPTPGDHASFGELGVETKRCIVKSVTPQQDLTAVVELEDEAPAIFQDLTEEIPVYDPGINRPRDVAPYPPEILEVYGDYVDVFVTIRLVSGFGRAVSRYEVQIRKSTPVGEWEDVPNVPAGGLVTATIVGLDLDVWYDVRVRTVGTNGLPSTWTVWPPFYHASRAVDIDRYVISNLTVENAIDGIGTFVGSDAVIRWELALADGVDVDPLSDTFGGSVIAETEASRFEGYAVRVSEAIFDEALGVYVSGQVVHEALVSSKTFSYTYDLNKDTGGPRRAAFIEVAAQIGGLRTPYSQVFVSNPPPAVPDLVSLSGIQGSRLEIELAGATDDADWDGYLVWVSPDSGFIPSLDTLLFKGKLDGVLIIPTVPGATYYVRYASFDKFSSDPVTLNVSAELSVTTGSIPGSVLQLYDLAVPRGGVDTIPFQATGGTSSPPNAWFSSPRTHHIKAHEDVAFVASYDGVLEVSYESWIIVDLTVAPTGAFVGKDLVVSYSVDSIEDPIDHLMLYRVRLNNVQLPELDSEDESVPDGYLRITGTGYIDVEAGRTYYISTWICIDVTASGVSSVTSWYDSLVMRQVTEA